MTSDEVAHKAWPTWFEQAFIAVVRAADELMGPVILPSASSRLSESVRELRRTQGRLHDNWFAYHYRHAFENRDFGDEDSNS